MVSLALWWQEGPSKLIKAYVVDTKETGFAASAFVTKAMVMPNSLHTNVCQVLTFRGNLLNLKKLIICSGICKHDLLY